MPKTQPSVLRGIFIGVAAGITATLVMDQFQSLTTAAQKTTEKQLRLAQGQTQWQIAREQAHEEHQAAQQEDSTEIFAGKIAGATGNQLSAADRRKAGRAVHYTFGTLMGVVYAVSAELLPETTTGAGTAFGTLLFLGADEVAVPAFQLSSTPSGTSTGTAAAGTLQHWAAHVVYGGTLDLVRRLLRRIL